MIGDLAMSDEIPSISRTLGGRLIGKLVATSRDYIDDGCVSCEPT